MNTIVQNHINEALSEGAEEVARAVVALDRSLDPERSYVVSSILGSMMKALIAAACEKFGAVTFAVELQATGEWSAENCIGLIALSGIETGGPK